MRFAIPCITPALLAAVLSAAPAHRASAADLSNVRLNCYVQTYSSAPPTVGTCGGFWTPTTADNPSVAVFALQGLMPGNYKFSWRDPATGQSVNCTGLPYCQREIGVGETKRLQVTVTDLDFYTSTTITARAIYYDAWN